MNENDLLAGIARHPDELDRWLVLSDWLEDQGDPRCELARLRYLLHTEPEHPERLARLARRQALHDSGLSPVVPTWTNALGMTFALVLPGTFQMGSPASEAGRFNDETLHTVELTKPFYMGVYPVTVGEFEKFVNARNHEPEWGASWRNPGFAQTARHPVAYVTWNDAQAMVKWLNETDKDGFVYALPTEAQWEYACRAGTPTAFWWGDDETKLGEHAWFWGNSGKKTYPVETKDANPWGLYHMLGHVWEWGEDWYGNLPSEGVGDPTGPSVGLHRVLRGGSWSSIACRCRSANRGNCDPARGVAGSGFRLTVSLRP